MAVIYTTWDFGVCTIDGVVKAGIWNHDHFGEGPFLVCPHEHTTQEEGRDCIFQMVKDHMEKNAKT